jgi:hypothetical protein
MLWFVCAHVTATFVRKGRCRNIWFSSLYLEAVKIKRFCHILIPPGLPMVCWHGLKHGCGEKIAWKQDPLLPRAYLASLCATCRSSQTKSTLGQSSARLPYAAAGLRFGLSRRCALSSFLGPAWLDPCGWTHGKNRRQICTDARRILFPRYFFPDAKPQP